MNQPPDEILDEIKKTIRNLNITSELFSQELIKEWEKKWNTQLDNTNFACFIYDSFPSPINFLNNKNNRG